MTQSIVQTPLPGVFKEHGLSKSERKDAARAASQAVSDSAGASRIPKRPYDSTGGREGAGDAGTHSDFEKG